MGPAERRAARGMPVPGIGADLSGGPASGTLALLAAGLPGDAGDRAPDTARARERLLAVTFNDLAVGGQEAELERAGALAANPRLHHVVVTGGEDVLPYAALDGPLTDEPGSCLSRRHGTGRGWPRQRGPLHRVWGHGRCWTPIRRGSPTCWMDRKRRHLRAAGRRAGQGRRFGAGPPRACTPRRGGWRGPRTAPASEVLSERLLRRRFDTPGDGAMEASLAVLSWAGPGPAARWLTGEALAEVSVRLQTSSQRSGGGAGAAAG